MKYLLVLLLALPLIGNATQSQPKPIVPLDDEVTIVMVGDVAQVSGPNKILIQVFDIYWYLMIQVEEEDCTPITVYVDLGALPNGTYHVKVTTTTGTVTRSVVKG
jgi:hypothetical protein